MDEDKPHPPGLLPYDAWTEEALRGVVARAVRHVAEHGLPGNHHFYISFRTDHAGVGVPDRLRAQYPEEMTIVLQHQFWDLRLDEDAATISVGLSFGGVPAKLSLPLAAITGFADPSVNFGLRFQTPADTVGGPVPPAAAPEQLPADAGSSDGPAEEAKPQVVSLDAFRRKPARRE
jgi:hypothetical protein